MTTSRGFGRAIDYLAAQAAHRIAGQPRAQPVRPAPDFRGESRAQTPSGVSLHDVTLLSDTLFGGNRRE